MSGFSAGTGHRQGHPGGSSGQAPFSGPTRPRPWTPCRSAPADLGPCLPGAECPLRLDSAGRPSPVGGTRGPGLRRALEELVSSPPLSLQGSPSSPSSLSPIRLFPAHRPSQSRRPCDPPTPGTQRARPPRNPEPTRPACLRTSVKSPVPAVCGPPPGAVDGGRRPHRRSRASSGCMQRGRRPRRDSQWTWTRFRKRGASG